ncbi:MAG: alpha-galactosidase [Anaerolineae bacterium]
MTTDGTHITLMPEHHLELAFDLLPAPEQPWKAVEADIIGEQARYRAGSYALTVRRAMSGPRSVIDFDLAREDGQTFVVQSYTLRCLAPVLDTYNVSPRFMGYAHVHHLNAPTFVSSCTSKDFPYVLYGSRNGENRFAIGLENQIIETEVTRHGRGGYMYYDTNLIQFVRPAKGASLRRRSLHDAVYLSTARVSWFHVTRDYWDWIDERRGYQPNPTPASAYGPVWCSWLYLTDIDERTIWENAVAARDLGIKTLIIDAGWFCSDTDIPFPDSPLTCDTLGFGRIDADKTKFPDMPGLVERIHRELGLYVWAWATPRWVFRAIEEGPGSVDRELLDCRIVTPQGETLPILCTRNPKAREHAARFTRYLLEHYGFDGLKFDCWEYGGERDLCVADHAHDYDTMGEGTLAWAQGIHDAMVAARPDAVVWLNNTTTKPYGNYSVSPNEIYCHPDENWRMSVVLKTYTRGIVSQLCEGSWHPDEANAQVARHMAILMMGHTPELQVDLTRLLADHQRIVRAWLDFYEAHKLELHWGDYEPFGFENMLGGPMSTTPPNVRITAEDEGFMWLGPMNTSCAAFDRPVDNVYLFNQRNDDALEIDLDGLPEGTWIATVHDVFLAPVAERTLRNGGVLSVRDRVPVGGMLHLAWRA